MTEKKEKVVVHWQHMRFDLIEVGPPPLQGSVKLSTARWAHFVDLYLGAGQYKLEEKSSAEELRARAIMALESALPERMPKLKERIERGVGFYVRHDPTLGVESSTLPP